MRPLAISATQTRNVNGLGAQVLYVCILIIVFLIYTLIYPLVD